MSNLKILGIAGSLRADSYNRRLLASAAKLAPPGIDLQIYTSLGDVPLFNEDLEEGGMTLPAGVTNLRAAIEDADAVLIATPEYNQSMPGVLKNAIDWMSRPPKSAFAAKPVALMGITAGEWGTRLSQAALRQTLFACGAHLVQVPHVYLRRAAALLDDANKLESSTADALRTLLEAIRDQITIEMMRRA